MMSDPAPDPTDVAPLEPRPVPRPVLPVVLSPPPLYSGYFVRERPAIVTAMGTTAIIVAVLSLLASAVAAVASLVMLIATQLAAAPVIVPRPYIASTNRSATMQVGRRGFNEV